MLQTQHISFKDWNPIGKPNWKKPHSLGDATSKSLDDVNLKRKDPQKNKDSFGQAATLELSEAGIEKALSAHKTSTYRITSRTLKVGCKGDDVRALQINLKKLGYNVGTSDGTYGSSTRNAVILFQRAYGLSGDGIAEKNTLEAIDYTVRQKNNNILSKGQVGSEVANLQKNLASLGYFRGKSDGIFGKDTESAIVAFQKRYGLTPDGLVGDTTKARILQALKNPPSVTSVGVYQPIRNGKQMNMPEPGKKIEVSLGTDKASIKAIVSNTNCWTIEYSIEGCRKTYPNGACTKRLNSALEKFSYNSGKADLLQLEIPELGKCYAGAMVEGFGNIGDVAEITLDNGTKFNFMILDTKSTKHKSSELSENNQCQNKWGHGYMMDNNNKVQLSICEFITSQSSKGVSSAKKYPSGSFLDGRYVKSAKIIGHANIE